MRSQKPSRGAFARTVFAWAFMLAIGFVLSGCSNTDETTGAAFTPATSCEESIFNNEAATGAHDAYIDISSVTHGYVAASATNSSHLKLQVINGENSVTYPLPNNGTPTIAPLTFGNGSYEFRIMQNTSNNNYVELYSATANVELTSEFEPYLRPNIYCNYTEESACVAKARELVAHAQNQGEAVSAICSYITENITYDNDKASQLKDATGYIPNPDSSLTSNSGICFDYASLGAAMLRSQGIPTKIVVGHVSPDNIYHAWIMVYIDGTWKNALFDVTPNTWSRIDLTFAASSSSGKVGDGKSYTDRYTY